MSDFLGHLASRTLGTTPVVAPRLPGRFETRALAGAGAEWVEESSERLAASPLPAPSAPERGSDDGDRPRADEPPDSRPEQIVPPRATEPARLRTDIREIVRSSEEGSSPESRGRDERRHAQPVEPRRGEISPRREHAPTLSPRAPSLPRPQPENAKAAPTIHVTIGRVEVRAIQRIDAAPPTKKSAEQPRVSLSAYLRRGARDQA